MTILYYDCIVKHQSCVQVGDCSGHSPSSLGTHFKTTEICSQIFLKLCFKSGLKSEYKYCPNFFPFLEDFFGSSSGPELSRTTLKLQFNLLLVLLSTF